MRIRNTDFDAYDYLAQRFYLTIDGDGDAGSGDSGDGGGDGGDGGDGGGDGGSGDGDGNSGDGGGDGDGGSGDGDGGDNWRSGIADPELKKVADRFTDPTAVVKAVRDLQKQQGNSIRIPGKNATPEEVAAYHKQIGVPEDGAGYEFPTPEGMTLNDAQKAEREQWGKDFKDAGLTKAQGDALIAKYYENEVAKAQAEIDADEDFVEETMAELRKQWPGEEFEINKTYAQRAIDHMFEDPDEAGFLELKNGRYLLDHPVMLRAFAEVGRQMEDRNLGGVMGEGARRTVQDQISEARTKAREASERGDRAEANRQSEIERTLLARLHGDAPVAGAAA
jgi:hypothetical protein